MGRQAFMEDTVDKIVERAMTLVQSGDTIAVFSNGGFGGIHVKLLEALKHLKAEG
jgi:UDP-N-acetylmuramate: L-alanyl-gamma-D-glutamyl-meso-diaminopimelate ligase